jgi:hypothetical protein
LQSVINNISNLILQWGIITTITPNTKKMVNFPIAFSNATPTIVATRYVESNSATAVAVYGKYTATQFGLYLADMGTSAQWFAIGN